MKKSKIFVLMMASAAMLMAAGCKESWLDPKPLSFYTPENTYVDAEGMYAALTAAERNMRHEVCGDAAPILTEYFGTDVAVSGKTDESGTLVDFDSYMLPTTEYSNYKNKLLWYWQEGFNGIKYANIVISRIDNATYESDAERNAVLGSAYFQRAYRYYKLTHQFGDVPFIEQEITSPKVDFYSNDRWSILEKLEEDLEFAYTWVSDDVDRGRTSKSACGVLLMKVAMCLGHFDRALEVGSEIVANHPLMTERFTTNQTKPNTNLMNDLHSVEAKLDMTNTEGLMYVVSYPYIEGSARMCIMRNALPYWAKGAAIVTPDGLSGTTISPASGDEGTYLDNDYLYGRGIGVLRPSNYYQYDIWAGEKEKNDLRGPNAPGSWVKMTDLYYNNPGLKGKSEWYGKHLVRPANMNVSDTVRCWYSWPHYKLFVPDPTKNTDRQGGETPWYIYRSAEVYLLMAECYYWKDMPEQEAEMLNVVRERAQAEPLTASEVGMEAILAERARELYYEEMRHTELVRISYTYALTGHPCEIFNGRVYKLDNISGPGGTGSNVKEEGYNFWYDWVMKVNNFFRERVEVANGTYTISVHHILWPVPNSAITANTKGVINQNIGYPGAENNITPLKVGETYSGE